MNSRAALLLLVAAACDRGEADFQIGGMDCPYDLVLPVDLDAEWHGHVPGDLVAAQVGLWTFEGPWEGVLPAGAVGTWTLDVALDGMPYESTSANCPFVSRLMIPLQVRLVAPADTVETVSGPAYIWRDASDHGALVVDRQDIAYGALIAARLDADSMLRDATERVVNFQFVSRDGWATAGIWATGILPDGTPVSAALRGSAALAGSRP